MIDVYGVGRVGDLGILYAVEFGCGRSVTSLSLASKY